MCTLAKYAYAVFKEETITCNYWEGILRSNLLRHRVCANPLTESSGNPNARSTCANYAHFMKHSSNEEFLLLPAQNNNLDSALRAAPF